MGNCIRREIGVENDTDRKINHEEMLRNIKQMKEVWKNRFNQTENEKQIWDRRNRLRESLDRSELGEHSVNYERVMPSRVNEDSFINEKNDNFPEHIQMTKSKLYERQDTNKLFQDLKPSKKLKNFEEDSYYSVENHQQFSSKLDSSLLNQNDKIDTNDKSYSTTRVSKHKKGKRSSQVIWNHEESKFFTIEK